MCIRDRGCSRLLMTPDVKMTGRNTQTEVRVEAMMASSTLLKNSKPKELKWFDKVQEK